MQSRFFRGCRLVCWIFLQVLPLLWIPCRVFQRLRVFKFLSASLPRIQPSHLFCIIHFMSPLDFNRNQLDSRVQRRPRLPTLCLPMDFLKLQLRMVDFLAVDFLVVDFRACLAPPLSRLCQLLFPKPLLSQFLPLRWHKRQAQKVHQSAYQETPSTAATSTPPCQPVHPLDFVGETSMLLQQAGFMVAQATNQEQHAMATQALHAAHVLHQQAQQALAPGCAPCHPVSDPVLQSLVSRVQEVKAMQQQGMELFKQFQSSQPRVPPGSVGVPVPPLSPASANRPVETPVHDVQSISSSPEKPASLHQRLPKVSKACEGSVHIQPGAVFHELGGMDTPPDIPSPVPTLVPTEIASPREEDLTALG